MKPNPTTLSDLVYFTARFQKWADKYHSDQRNKRAFIEASYYARLVIYTVEQLNADPEVVCPDAVHIATDHQISQQEASEPQNECDDCGTAISQHDVYCDDCGKANHEAQYGDMDNHYDDSVWN